MTCPGVNFTSYFTKWQYKNSVNTSQRTRSVFTATTSALQLLYVISVEYGDQAKQEYTLFGHDTELLKCYNWCVHSQLR
jgi:hypothetical protein